MYKVDELNIYRGLDIPITDKIFVSQPSVDEIREFGEQKYFSAIYNLTSVGADLKWQLWDIYHIDYTTIKDYDLFIKLIWQLVSSKKHILDELITHPEKYKDEIVKLNEEDLLEMSINPLKLVLKERVSYKRLCVEIDNNYASFGNYVDNYGIEYSQNEFDEFKNNPLGYKTKDIDFSDYKVMQRKNNSQIVLYNEKRDIIIDRLVYAQLVDVVRKIHGLKRNNQMPANERTKMDLIEDARDEAMASANKPYKSVILPLLSSLKVKCGQCGNDMIWNMKIGELLYDIRRANKIQDAEALIQGAYSGFASLKDVDKKRLDWTGDLDS